MDTLLPKEQWLSLAEAAHLLNVHPTTLRRWANNGDIMYMTTPGGHRRFSYTSINALRADHQGPVTPQALTESWAHQALLSTRKQLCPHAKQPIWLTPLDENARMQHRILGNRVLSLIMQSLAKHPLHQAVVHEAKQIGQEYAVSAKKNGLALTDVLQASMFFRDSLVNVALQLSLNSNTNHLLQLRLVNNINLLINTIQLAIVEQYNKTPTISPRPSHESRKQHLAD